MALTRRDVEAVAHLARLSLTEAELERYGAQLEAILGYVESLNRLPLEGVEPTTHLSPATDRARPDRPAPGLTQAEVEALAPEFRAGSVRVPKILEE
ncbi:MAG: Asp-tRNA(Asn)/Glu-tRNA(Gln) amidotransferase subunit GatC [Candidatus Coatesbacteria bacterium]